MIFESSKSAIARSKVLLKQFCDESKKVIEDDFFVWREEWNEGLLLYEYKIKCVKSFPCELSEIAWESMSYLRKALDRAAYALSQASGGRERVYFPIAATKEKSEECQRSFGNLPHSVFQCMMNFKPYMGGDDRLWALHLTNNIDKHRYLAPVATLAGGPIEVSVRIPGHMKGCWYTPAAAWDYEKKEMVLACYSDLGDHAGEFKVLVFPSLSGHDLFLGQPADFIIGSYIKLVSEIISDLEAEAVSAGVF